MNLEQIFKNSYKKVRIPTGEMQNGCRVVEEVSEFDVNSAIIAIRSHLKEEIGKLPYKYLGKDSIPYVFKADLMKLVEGK